MKKMLKLSSIFVVTLILATPEIGFASPLVSKYTTTKGGSSNGITPLTSANAGNLLGGNESASTEEPPGLVIEEPAPIPAPAIPTTTVQAVFYDGIVPAAMQSGN